MFQIEQGDEYRGVVYDKRGKIIAEGKEVLLTTRLHHDVFNAVRFLPPGFNMKVVIQKSAPDFPIIAKSNEVRYKTTWLESTLDVNRVVVSPAIREALRSEMRAGIPAYIPFVRTDARAFEVPQGSRHYRASSIFSGSVPVSALLVFLPTESLGYGEVTNNPLLFQAYKYKVNYIQFFVNEKPVLSKPYTPNFETGEYVAEYNSLLRVLNLDQSRTGCSMTYTNFGEDYGIFAVSFQEFRHLKDVNLSLEVRFASGTTANLSGLFIPQYRSYLELDDCGGVSQFDY